MKRSSIIVVLLFVTFSLVLSLSGCASLAKKFTPKKKVKAKKQIFHKLTKYEVKPSMELYEKHYIFWANWQSELISELGRNFKNDIRNIQEIIGNLDDMYALLSDEEGNKLKPHIDELKKAQDIIVKRNMTTFNEIRIRRIIERESRTIERKFTPRKMKGKIRGDWRKEG